MPIQRLKPLALIMKYSTAFCAGCRQDARDDQGDQVWTVWAPEMYYCPACAVKQGVGPNDY